MHKQKTAPPKSAQQGVILLEAMIAILIFSFTILGIVGLQAAMIKNTTDSKYRAEAGYIAQQRIGNVWANPDPTSANYVSPVETNTDISALLPRGTLTVTRSTPVITSINPPAYTYSYSVTVTVEWQQPGPNETRHQLTTTASIGGD